MEKRSEQRKPPVAMESTRLLELLVEQVVDYAIFVLDADGYVATWNPGAERIKGYRPAEIIGKPYAIFFTDEERLRGRPEEILAEARARGRFAEEAWRIRKDGSRFWSSVVLTALHDNAGVLKGFAKITRDLTERLKVEEEARLAAAEQAARQQAELDERTVRRSRDELDLILKSIGEGILVQTTEGRFTFVNDAAARLCGFDSAREMLATPPREILDRFELRREDGTPLAIEDLPARAALQGKPTSMVVRFRSKRSGEERWSFVSAATGVDRDGKIEFAVSVFREFTERKRTEEAWQFLADASSILGSSLDYAVTLRQLAELAVPRIADWCSVEILGPGGELRQLAVAHADPSKLELAKEWRRRWPPMPNAMVSRVAATGIAELLPEITNAMIEAAATDPEQRRVILMLGLRSAVVVPLVVGQKPFGAVSFLSAASGRRYAREDLILAVEIGRRAALAIENARAYADERAAVEVRDNFLSIASHELRTPLSALTVLTATLVRAAEQGRLMQLGAEGLKQRLLRAERQTKQLGRLVDRLLDVKRLSSRETVLDLEAMDLAELAREVIARFEEAAGTEGRATLTVDGPSLGRWDRSRLDQVLSNLIENAFKYGGGSPVGVFIDGREPAVVRFTIRDHGPGISAPDRERVFHQFERAAAQSSPGMGLGLWLVKRIVAAHGGTVSLDSREDGPEAGAAFTVILPVEPPAPGKHLNMDEPARGETT